jgi:hypothetical protein
MVLLHNFNIALQSLLAENKDQPGGEEDKGLSGPLMIQAD